MARGTRLGTAVAKLKECLRQNLTPGVAVANDSLLALATARNQDLLSTQYDWPFLEERWDVQIVPYPTSPSNPTSFQPWRYYNYPTIDEDNVTVAINLERPLRTWVWWTNAWLPVEYGIGVDQFNWRNSDGNPPNGGNPPETLDPIQRWQDNDQNQFEIWPIPSSNQIFRFVGQRVLNSLITYASQSGTSDSVTPNWNATLDLDDELTVFSTAAELLKEKNSAQWQTIAAAAQNRMAYVRASYRKYEMSCGFGKNAGKEYNQIIPVRKIAVA